MANVALYLDARKLNKDGTAPIKVVMRSKGQASYCKTGMSCPPDCWKDGKVIRGKSAGMLSRTPAVFNSILKEELSKYELALIDVGGHKTSLPASKLMRLVTDHILGVSPSAGNESTLFALIDDYCVKKMLQESTVRGYATFKNNVSKYVKNAETLEVSDIDEDFVCGFYKFLSDKVTNNSSKNYMDHLQGIINYAKKKGFYPATSDPFEGKKFRLNSVQFRNIPIDEFRDMWVYDAEKHKFGKQTWRWHEKIPFALDVMRLMFCLCGINIADLFEIAPSDIVNGRIVKKRHKSGSDINIKVEPEAMEIINRISTPKSIIGFEGNPEDLNDTHRFAKSINDSLKRVRKGTTIYSIRHTWATIAFDLDIPDQVVAMGLSHKFGVATNQYYINKNYEKLDVANRKILDYVMQK